MNNEVYLDYSATTPVDNDVLEEYINTTKTFIANPNSPHKLGQESKKKLYDSIYKIAKKLNCYSKELIFTSCASESNAYAIRGVAQTCKIYGKHIITTPLEHKSVLEEMKRLKKLSYDIEYVNILKNGQVDLNDLENKIRKDTILVSICGVNSEVGYCQDLKSIRKIIDKKNKNVVFHSDLTQALGKTKIDLSILDLASFSGHKIYAPKGIGILYKKRTLAIDKLICGGTVTTPYRGGTPNVALISALSVAINKCINDLDTNINKCKSMKKILIDNLSKYDKIHINSNNLCVPQIINFSLVNMKSEYFIKELEKYNIYVSSNTACSSLSESLILKEIYNDSRISTTSIRISISHLTSIDEINYFLKIFNKIYN